MPSLHEEEIAARVARRLGLAFRAARVLGRRTNVLVHLRPAPVVARVTRQEALAAYGPHDQSVAEVLGPLVVLFTAAWGSLAPHVGEEVGPRTRLRLDWLRERYGGRVAHDA